MLNDSNNGDEPAERACVLVDGYAEDAVADGCNSCLGWCFIVEVRNVGLVKAVVVEAVLLTCPVDNRQAAKSTGGGRWKAEPADIEADGCVVIDGVLGECAAAVTWAA